MLTLTALIWGSAFVAQRAGMTHVGPFTFNAVRSLLGGLVLLPIIAFRGRSGHASGRWLMGGVVCGVALFAGSILQQFGLAAPAASAGKAGFLTALYIVLVPVLRAIMGHRGSVKVWVSVVLAVGGLYALCLYGSRLTLSGGDIWLLLGALAFAVHILLIDRWVAHTDSLRLSCVQFFTCAALSAVGMLLREQPQPQALLDAWLPLVYAGVLSSGVGYTLQVAGQKRADPAVASLILSLESVFAVLAGWLILHERLLPHEMVGCALMLAAVVMAQWPERGRRRA